MELNAIQQSAPKIRYNNFKKMELYCIQESQVKNILFQLLHNGLTVFNMAVGSAQYDVRSVNHVTKHVLIT